MRIHLGCGLLAGMAMALAAGPVPVMAQSGAAATIAPVPASPQAPAVSATDPASAALPDVTPPAAARAANSRAPTGVPGNLLPKDLSIGAMFYHADIVVQVVLAGLIGASVVTWTFLLGKGVSVLRAQRSVSRALTEAEGEHSLAALQLHMRRLPSRQVQRAMTDATAAEMALSAGQDAAGIKERVASRLHRLEAAAGRQMARGTGVLATIGSTSPFVGLFGTVWGIMNSFIGISQSQTTNLAVVAPGIAEALLATATGLVAAIPAVVIYNVFARAIAGYRASLADLSAAILRLVSRELDRRSAGRNRAAAAE